MEGLPLASLEWYKKRWFVSLHFHEKVLLKSVVSLLQIDVKTSESHPLLDSYQFVFPSRWCRMRKNNLKFILKTCYNLTSIFLQLLEDFQTSYPGLDFPSLPERGDFDLQNVLDSPYFFNWASFPEDSSESLLKRSFHCVHRKIIWKLLKT